MHRDIHLNNVLSSCFSTDPASFEQIWLSTIHLSVDPDPSIPLDRSHLICLWPLSQPTPPTSHRQSKLLYGVSLPLKTILREQSLTRFHSNQEWAFSEWHVTKKRTKRKRPHHVFTIESETVSWVISLHFYIQHLYFWLRLRLN